MARRKAGLLFTALISALIAHGAAQAQSINAGKRPASAKTPFAVEAIARFDTPWAIAFLPDGRMLVTESPAGSSSSDRMAAR